MFPLAHPSSLIFSFSQNSVVCKQERGPCLLIRTGDQQTASTVCVCVCDGEKGMGKGWKGGQVVGGRDSHEVKEKCIYLDNTLSLATN